MSNNTRFLLTIACFMGLAFIWGALFQAHYIAQQTALSSLTDREIEAERANVPDCDWLPCDITESGVPFADSVAFQLAASLATEIDMPEELPTVGDTMCAFVCGGTIYVEYWHGFGYQRRMFRYVHGE